MKHFASGLFFCFILLLTAYGSYAQDSTRRSRYNVLTINPLSAVTTNLSVFYERRLTKHSTAQAGYSFYHFKNVLGSPISFAGHSYTLEYRYYFTGKEKQAPRGFYIGPYVRSSGGSLGFLAKDPKTQIEVSTSASVSQNIIGCVAGFQSISRGGFVFDVYIGPFYRHDSYSISAGVFGVSVPFGLFGASGLWFRTGIGLGYAF